jgi:hypothetical protein
MPDPVPEPPRPGTTDRRDAPPHIGVEPHGEPHAAEPDTGQSAAAPQEPPKPMLDVHPAHGAVRSWRDFFVHILIIAIGLGLALTLQQIVEYFHDRHQVADTRRALAQERAENRQTFAVQTARWRWVLAELQNNLLVLQYLEQHPGTAQEKLPGVLLWKTGAFAFSRAVWDAARESGVVALMPREEIEHYSELYETLDREWSDEVAATQAVLDAERYNLTDADPSHLSPEQVRTEIDLVRAALEKHWLVGGQMVNLWEAFPDFPATVTREELAQLRHTPDAETTQRLGPAYALTMERLKAAGYGKPVPSDSQPR